MIEIYINILLVVTYKEYSIVMSSRHVSFLEHGTPRLRSQIRISVPVEREEFWRPLIYTGNAGIESQKWLGE